jgi:DNA-binding GntR family transcriptional regulator
MQNTLQEAHVERPEHARSLTKAIYAQIRDDILAANLRPGEKLRVGELCDRYGYSSTPVREALMLLAAENFVRSEEMRGFFVAAASPEEFLELTETRCMVEEVALARSIERGGDDWEARLVVAFHRLARGTRPQGGELFDLNPDWVRRHNEFHDALLAACGSRLILEFCRQLRDRSYRYRRIASFEREDGWLAEHEAVLTATIDRDSEKAVELLKEHYRKTAEITIRRWTGQQPDEKPQPRERSTR